MKKIFLVLFTVIISLLWFDPVLAEQNITDPTTTDNLTVKVGVYDNYPKIYKDEQGNIKGFWADVTNYIAKKENWNLIYDFGSWDQELAKLERGDIDILVDVAVSEDRKIKFDFNNEVALLSWSIIYTREGFDVTSFKDLEGSNIALIKSSVHYTAPLGLKNVLAVSGVNANIIDVLDFDQIFKMLNDNAVDAGVVNWQYGLANEGKYKVNRTGIIFNPSELFYAFPKNANKNSYLINVIDTDLGEMKNSPQGAYYQAINKNLGQYLEKIEVLPSWWNYFFQF